MNKNERPSFLRGKGAAVGIVICFVAVIAMVGAYTFNNYQKQIEEQVAKAEDQAEELTEEKSEEAAADDIVLPDENEETGKTDAGQEEPEEAQEQDSVQNGGVSSSESETSASGGTGGVWFSEESTLAWPASGAVLISYSMDQTIFFQTLEQYQYNPAMMVSGEVGEIIGASAPGIVTEIEELAETGTTVTLDMGNGYTAVYGQLTDVPLAVGDYVNTGETVGTLAEPTKYFSIEGPNLYFEVTKDGEPVDPMNYME